MENNQNGPTPAKDPFDETVRVAAHLEPAIPRPEQAKIASEKLAALRAKTGRAPNIDHIEVVTRGDVRRAKLYYLRERSGKSARIKEKLA